MKVKQIVGIVVTALLGVKVNAADLGKLAPVAGTPYSSQNVTN
jgi:hypothetical protein